MMAFVDCDVSLVASLVLLLPPEWSNMIIPFSLSPFRASLCFCLCSACLGVPLLLCVFVFRLLACVLFFLALALIFSLADFVLYADY